MCPGPLVTRGTEALEWAGRSRSHNGWGALLAFLCLADSLPPPSELSSKVMPSGKAPPASLSRSTSFVLLGLHSKPQASLHGSENGIQGLTITALSRDNTCTRSPERQGVKAAQSILDKTSRGREEAQSRQRDKEVRAQR